MTQPKPQGSFRDAKFYVSDNDTEIGRRADTASLPFSEKGVVSADVGRKPRKYSITAFMLGPNHREDRDTFIKAIETPGPGLLEHPKFGRVNVLILTARVSEKTAEKNKVTVTFTAEEHFDAAKSQPRYDTGAAVKRSALAGVAAAGESFESPLTGLRRAVNDFVAASNLAVLDDVLAGMRQVNGMVTSVLSIPGNFAAQIDAISKVGAQLLDTPRRLFDALDGTFAVLAQATRRIVPGSAAPEAIENILQPLRAGRTLRMSTLTIASLGDGVDPVPPIDTPDRVEQAASQLAIQRHSRAIGLLRWADAAADTEFDSAGDARLARDALTEALVDLADSEPDMDPNLTVSLRNTAAQLSAHLTQLIGSLPVVVTYTPRASLPVEVVAYNLYGDANRADEIVARNPVLLKHPGFVPGGQAIEVLDE